MPLRNAQGGSVSCAPSQFQRTYIPHALSSGARDAGEAIGAVLARISQLIFYAACASKRCGHVLFSVCASFDAVVASEEIALRLGHSEPLCLLRRLAIRSVRVITRTSRAHT